MLRLGLAIALALVASAPATANVMKFTFNPNVFFDRTANLGDGVSVGQTKADQPEARRLRTATEQGPITGDFCTYTNDLTGYNTYLNWRDSLGESEGIRKFSLWLHPEWYGGYGMTLGLKPLGSTDGTPSTAVVEVTGANGWSGKVVTNYSFGGIIVWYTDDPTKYLRPGGADLESFSFTADVAEYATHTSTPTGDAVLGHESGVLLVGLARLRR